MLNILPEAYFRGRLGLEIDILHDIDHRLAPREAAELVKTVEPLELYWLEEPTPAEDYSRRSITLIKATLS